MNLFDYWVLVLPLLVACICKSQILRWSLVGLVACTLLGDIGARLAHAHLADAGCLSNFLKGIGCPAGADVSTAMHWLGHVSINLALGPILVLAYFWWLAIPLALSVELHARFSQSPPEAQNATSKPSL